MTWALISSKHMQFIHMPIKLGMICIYQDWFNYPWNYWSGSSNIFILIAYFVCCALHRVRIIFYSHSNSFIFAIKKKHARLLYHATWFMYTKWCYSKYLQPLAFNHVETSVRRWKFIAVMSNYSLNSSYPKLIFNMHTESTSQNWNYLNIDCVHDIIGASVEWTLTSKADVVGIYGQIKSKYACYLPNLKEKICLVLMFCLVVETRFLFSTIKSIKFLNFFFEVYSLHLILIQKQIHSHFENIVRFVWIRVLASLIWSKSRFYFCFSNTPLKFNRVLHFTNSLQIISSLI